MSEPEKSDSQSDWSAGDIGYLGLDTVGFVSVADETADAAVVSEYAAEGKYLEAGLSLVSEISVVGTIIVKSEKNAKSISRNTTLQVIKAVKKLDVPKFTNKFNSNPKLAPHIDKIIAALQKWQNDISQNFGKTGVSAGMVKYPVTVTGTIIDTKSTETIKNLDSALSKIFDKINNKINLLDTAPPKDSAIFYAEKVGDKPSREVADDILKTSDGTKANISETELGEYLTDTETQRLLKQLPPNVQDILWIRTARKYAQSVKGDVELVADVSSISPNKMFYLVEIDAILNNADVSETSKLKFQQIKQQLDAGFEGDKNVHD